MPTSLERDWSAGTPLSFNGFKNNNNFNRKNHSDKIYPMENIDLNNNYFNNNYNKQNNYWKYNQNNKNKFNEKNNFNKIPVENKNNIPINHTNDIYNTKNNIHVKSYHDGINYILFV